MAEFTHWYYNQIPRLLWRAGRGFLHQAYQVFSLPILARTLFEPWRHDYTSTDNVPFVQRFNILMQNIFSRVIGAGVRVITMGIGVISMGMIFVISWTTIISWIILPVLISLLFGMGVRIMVGGA